MGYELKDMNENERIGNQREERKIEMEKNEKV